MSPISPARNLGHGHGHGGGSPHTHSNATSPRPPQPQQIPPLQATDFPPLTSVAAVQEKKAPVVAGAWGNSSSTRSILMPAPSNGTGPSLNGGGAGTALINHLSNSGARLEEPDRGFERPQTKVTYNSCVILVRICCADWNLGCSLRNCSTPRS